MAPVTIDLMARKPRTPSDIAKTKPEKKTYSFHLVKEPVEKLKAHADAVNVPVSELIDEAIKSYLEAIGD